MANWQLCSKCGRHKTQRPDGICGRCAHIAKHTAARRDRRRLLVEEDDEEDRWTEEMVEALVAEQMADLPSWWEHAAEMARRHL